MTPRCTACQDTAVVRGDVCRDCAMRAEAAWVERERQDRAARLRRPQAAVVVRLVPARRAA